MGWLWNEIHDMFDKDDGELPEICICNLSPQEVVNGYSLIRQAGCAAGGPRFFNLEAGEEMELDQVANAAELVARRKAHPFHFMVRNLRFADGCLSEIGVFILDNAIALDYEKSPLWGEIQIETFMLLIKHIVDSSENAHIQLEETIRPEDKVRFNECLKRLGTEES